MIFLHTLKPKYHYVQSGKKSKSDERRVNIEMEDLSGINIVPTCSALSISPQKYIKEIKKHYPQKAKEENSSIIKYLGKEFQKSLFEINKDIDLLNEQFKKNKDKSTSSTAKLKKYSTFHDNLAKKIDIAIDTMCFYASYVDIFTEHANNVPESLKIKDEISSDNLENKSKKEFMTTMNEKRCSISALKINIKSMLFSEKTSIIQGTEEFDNDSILNESHFFPCLEVENQIQPRRFHCALEHDFNPEQDLDFQLRFNNINDQIIETYKSIYYKYINFSEQNITLKQLDKALFDDKEPSPFVENTEVLNFPSQLKGKALKK